MKKKALFAVITDTHIDKDNLATVDRVFVQLFDYCIANQIKTVIHDGDWFIDRTGQLLACSLLIKKIIKKFTKAGITIHTIPGNHDKPDLDSDDSYLTLYEDLPHFNLYSTAGSYDYNDRITFHFLPYYKNPEKYLTGLVSIIDNLDEERINLLFTHASINGVRNNDGTVVADDVEVNFFKVFKMVYVGHYHDEQFIKPNIHYIGSDKQMNYGEKDNKGFKVYYNDDTLEHVDTVYPAFQKIVIPASDPAKAVKLLQQFEELKEKGQKLNLRVIFTGTQQEIEALDVSKYQTAGIDVKKENIDEAVLFENMEDAELVVMDKKSIIKGWNEYAAAVAIPNDKRVSGLKLLTLLNFSK